jgi:hypothetical protein
VYRTNDTNQSAVDLQYGAGVCDGCVFANNIILASGKPLAAIKADCPYLPVTGNNIASDGDGIHSTGSIPGHAISGNTIRLRGANTSTGILIDAGREVAITGNFISGTGAQTGVYLYPSQHDAGGPAIAGNQFFKLGKAVEFDPKHDAPMIMGNTCSAVIRKQGCGKRNESSGANLMQQLPK